MYCNWLTTGDFESGAYSISNGVVTDVMDHAAAQAAVGTVYVIPTEDEWYKAAYYSVSGGSFSGYANGTDTMASGLKVTGENHLKATDPGGLGLWTVGEGMLEQNGTYDMGGNLAEFTETIGPLGRVVRDAPYSFTLKSGAVENSSNSKAETYQNSVYSVRLAVLEADETTAQGVPVSWMNDHGVSSDYDTAELTDTDGDGLLMWEEYYCGTDPDDKDSAFRAALNGSELSWTATTANGITLPFDVYRSTDLLAGWIQVATNVVRSATGTTTWTDPNPPVDPSVFYKTVFEIP
jgi:hypothetical protein